MEKNKSQRIREWLATQSRPQCARTIAGALGLDLDRLWSVLSHMASDGRLSRSYRGRTTLYGPGRDLMVAEKGQFTGDERVARIRALESAARRRKGQKPREVYLAEVKAAAAERIAAKAAKPSGEFRKRLHRQVQDKMAAKPSASAHASMSAHFAKSPARAAEPDRVETVAEFLARGGRIDREPAHWEHAA